MPDTFVHSLTLAVISSIVWSGVMRMSISASATSGTTLVCCPAYNFEHKTNPQRSHVL